MAKGANCTISGTLLLAVLAMPASTAATPIKVRVAKTTASGGQDIAYATDGLTRTKWTPGSTAPQSLYLDLGHPVAIGKIRLYPGRSTTDTVHDIYVGQTNPPTTWLRSVTVKAGTSTWIDVDCVTNLSCGNVRYLTITTSSGTPAGWYEIAVYQGLEYFGYYGDAGLGNDLLSWTTQLGANVHMLERPDNPATGRFDTQAWTDLFNQVPSSAKVVLSLATALFKSWCNTPAAPRECADGEPAVFWRLRTGTDGNEWREQWALISSFISSRTSRIAALYPLDEPYGHAASAAELQLLANTIRQSYSIPIATILAPSEFMEVTPDISMFDWVGFDWYAPWATTGIFVGNNVTKLEDVVARFKQLANGKRFIAVPSAYEGQGPKLFANEWEIVDAIGGWQGGINANYPQGRAGWHREVMSDPRYIAVIPFSTMAMLAPPRDPYTPYTQVLERFREMAISLLQPGLRTVYPVASAGSAFIPGYEPTRLFDKDNPFQLGAPTWAYPGDYWTPGPPTGAVLFDLGGSTRLTKIDLTIGTAYATPTRSVHYLHGWDPVAGAWFLLPNGVLDVYAKDTDVLTWSGSVDASALMVSTTVSSSNVAWHEITMTRD